MRHSSLRPHPTTPCPAIAGIDVRVSTQPDGDLILTYTMSGDLTGLLIPDPTLPIRKDELWRHTCFEAFVMADYGPGYREFNFSPSGEWAAYDFHDYRNGTPLALATDPAIACRACDYALELEVRLSGPALPKGVRLHLGLSAVIEEKQGALSYWALQHPPGKPDFHHTGAFALILEQP